MNRFLSKVKADTYFFPLLSLICATYLIYELLYIPYWALSADEFVFARHIYEYTFHMPYRDFAPYKTILGYYLLSLPFFFSKSILTPLFFIKDEIAILNTLCLALATYWSRPFFNKKALLITLLAILANQTFLLYGTDLRVDMLTSWFCLFTALAILHQRIKLAGLIMAGAFLISQKALWAFVAINGAMLLCYLIFDTRLYSLRSIFHFNFVTALPIGGYIIFWSLFAGHTIVLHNLFYEAYIQAGIDWYTPIYLSCWLVVLTHGPLLFFLWPVVFLSIKKEFSYHDVTQRRIFILCFASISLLLFISYKQAFPYNFVFTIPAFFLLYADFLSWLENNPITTKPTSLSLVGCGLYALAVFSLVYLGQLPALYYSAMLIPFLLCNIITRDNILKIRLILGILALTGIILPFISSLNVSEKVDGRYQQAMLSLTDQLLNDGGSYVAGIPYLYNKDQAVDGMQNLIGPALEYLYQPTPKLATLLLPSLYLAPVSSHDILMDFERKPVKVILDNYRIKYLPPIVLEYINHEYQQFAGSIYLYAPMIEPNQLTFSIKFAGKYQVMSDKLKFIFLDGKKIKVDSTIELKVGDHLTEAKKSYRLVYLPEGVFDKYVQYKTDDWVMMIKAIIA